MQRRALYAVLLPSVALAQAPLCQGTYADDLNVLAPQVRELERNPQSRYSHCLRTSATYECLSYAPDGTIRRARKTVLAHGTAFAYRRTGGDTLLITNDHVASWPQVTDDEHKVEEVPSGCKMVAESLRIVDDESDEYEANDVTLTRIVGDPELDIALLKTRTPLPLIPYRVGHSGELHVGNVVAVHGYPLGAFPATNMGKVVNAYDRDTARDWDHVDFVIDALLSPGNSGSPVLAVSCKSGEYELVGVYHAGYVNGSALNVIVGIDQLRDLLSTLKRTARVAEGTSEQFGPSELALLRSAGSSPFFPFGPLVASVTPTLEGLRFEVHARNFPLQDQRLLVLEDTPHGRIYLGNRRGLKSWRAAQLDGDAQTQLQRIRTRLRASAMLAVRYRSLDGATKSGERQQRLLDRSRDRHAALDRDAAQALSDLADRLGPKAGEPTVSYAKAIADPVPAPAPSVTVDRRKSAGDSRNSKVDRR